MRKTYKSFISVVLAAAISLGNLVSPAIPTFAAESDQSTEIQVQETETWQTEQNIETEGEAKSETGTEAELTQEEQVQVSDIEITEGEAFEAATNFSGLTFDREKVKVTFKEAANAAGEAFSSEKPGTYQAFYTVEPYSGKPAYEITRKIVVKAKEPETQKKSNNGGEQQEESGDDAESDPEADPALLNMEAKKGIFLSVTPASTANSRIKAELEKGERIWYPSDLGYYYTCWFTVNGRVAYCIESNKSTPPSADYVAEIYESNLNLQKVLYYGYGGPGDLSASYLKGYSEELRYILTHLAASYVYAGETAAFTGCTESGLQKYGVREYIQYLYSQEAPPSAELSLTGGEQTAYLEGDLQRTKTMTLKGDHRNYIQVKLPENVTYHNTDKGEQTGGTVKISGGTSFYFTAPKNKVSGTWNSGTLDGQLGGQWKTLVVSTGGVSQDIGYGEFFDTEKDSVSFSIKWLSISKIKIIKKDEEYGERLSGCVFGIYSDKACTKLIQEMPETNEKGESEAELVNAPATVYLKEIRSANGFLLNTTVYPAEVKTGKTVTVDISNEEQKGKIVIHKTGEALKTVSGTDPLTFVYENQGYAGAEYEIYAAEDIYSQNGRTKVHSAGDRIETLKTDSEGNAVSSAYYLGKYKVVETKAPDLLTLGKTEAERTREVTLSYGGQTVSLVTEEVSYQNQRPEVKIQVVKKSKNDGAALQGAKFGLYAAEDIFNVAGEKIVQKDTLIETVTSDAEGNAVFTADLPIGYQYCIKEVQAPEFYYQSEQEYTFTYDYKNDTTYRYTFTHEFENEEVRGEIHVKKIDRDSGDFISQGDASLSGAKYALYAAEDIQHPNGKSGVVYKKDEQVAECMISAEGTAAFTDLYLGSYYLKETSAGEGYLVDETRYDVTLSYGGQDVKVIRKDITVTETVKKQAFQIIKISEDGEQTETDLIQGAGFKVFLISDLKGVQDGSITPGEGSSFTAEDFIGYDYSEDETAAYYENGKKQHVPELFSDKTGYVKSPELPYGDYVVFESTVPENLTEANPFLVHISEDSREPQVWRILDDRPFEFLFKIVKKDAQTGENVLNNSAYYKIYDMEAEKYVEMKVRYPKEETVSVFQTNEEGYLLTPEQLKSSTYRIEEVKSPENYVKVGYEQQLVKDGVSVPLDEPVEGGNYEGHASSAIVIQVDSNTVHQVEGDTGNYIITVEQKNDEAVGSLTIHKKAEQLTGAKRKEQQFTTAIKNGFVQAVNAVAGIFTEEEILEPETGYLFEYEEMGLSGAVFEIHAAETIVSPDGKKDSEGNPLVRYEKDELVGTLTTDETGTAVMNNLPIGKFYLVETKSAFPAVLDPEKKSFEITYQGEEVAVGFVTMDLTNERQKVQIEAHKYDTETKEPIEGAVFGLYTEEPIQDVTGEVVVEKDTLIEKSVSDENGKVTFTADLPHGVYYIKELEPKPGYLENEEIYHFDASYTEETKEFISFSQKIENQPTHIEVTKYDVTDQKELPGASLEVWEKDGERIDAWVSTKEAHVIRGLEIGKTYILKEIKPADGYVTAEEVEFTVEDTGEVQPVAMYDDVTKVEISKQDITDESEIEGAALMILTEHEKVVESWTSTTKPHYIEKLPVGKYILREKTAANGYLTAQDVSFEVKDTGEIQKVVMKDARAMGKLILNKSDADTGKALKGVKYELRDMEGKVLETLTTDSAGHAESKEYPIGIFKDGKMTEEIKYQLAEVECLDGYELDKTVYEIVFPYKDGETAVVEVIKDFTNQKIPEMETTEETDQTPTDKIDAPKTGDTTKIWIPVSLGAISLMTLLLLLWRKYRKKTNDHLSGED